MTFSLTEVIMLGMFLLALLTFILKLVAFLIKRK